MNVYRFWDERPSSAAQPGDWDDVEADSEQAAVDLWVAANGSDWSERVNAFVLNLTDGDNDLREVHATIAHVVEVTVRSKSVEFAEEDES